MDNGNGDNFGRFYDEAQDVIPADWKRDAAKRAGMGIARRRRRAIMSDGVPESYSYTLPPLSMHRLPSLLTTRERSLLSLWILSVSKLQHWLLSGSRPKFGRATRQTLLPVDDDDDNRIYFHDEAPQEIATGREYDAAERAMIDTAERDPVAGWWFERVPQSSS
jgi:hypothetical protein